MGSKFLISVLALAGTDILNIKTWVTSYKCLMLPRNLFRIPDNMKLSIRDTKKVAANPDFEASLKATSGKTRGPS